MFPASRSSPRPLSRNLNNNNNSSTSRASRLPDLPQTGPSFSDEVQQDMNKRFSTGSQSGSILFPAQSKNINQQTTQLGTEGGNGNGHSRMGSDDEGARLGSMLFPPVPVRRRSQSSPVGRDAGIRNSTTSTLLPYERNDGDDADEEEADEAGDESPREMRNLNGGGGGSRSSGNLRSAIASSRSKGANGHKRVSSVYSQSSMRRTAGGTTTALDYLMMEERDREERSIDETPRTRNKRLALIKEKKRLEAEKMLRGNSQQTDLESPTDSRRNTALPPFAPQTGYAEGGPVREDQQYSREEAWYLLRALVGQEIKEEQGMLWKLQNLDAREDMFSAPDA